MRLEICRYIMDQTAKNHLPPVVNLKLNMADNSTSASEATAPSYTLLLHTPRSHSDDPEGPDDLRFTKYLRKAKTHSQHTSQLQCKKRKCRHFTTS